MPYYTSSEEWLEQSLLLLEARPSTTRITTKFSIKPVKPRKTKASDAAATTTDDDTEAKPPRGSLVIKTYDPVSGVTLKYRTTKAAEVSRLIYSSLGRLGRGMAGLPDAPPDEPMGDAPAEGTTATGGKVSVAGGGAAAASQPQPQQQSGGGKKKKKGKK